MNIISNNFVVIYEDYMLATGDAAMAAIIAVIERLSKYNTGKLDSWVKVNAKTIETMTVGIVAKRTVSKKIDQLKKLGLIESITDENNWQQYKINRSELEKIVLSKPSAYTPAAYTPSTLVAYTPSTPVAYTSTPVAYTLYASSVDIKNSIESNNKKTNETETPISEKQKPTRNENMDEQIRTLLKAYDKIPKSKRDRFCRGSLISLYKNYGDSLEKIIEQYGLDSCLEAFENFKQDTYWEGRGFPIRAFISQIEKYVKKASRSAGGRQGVEEDEEIDSSYASRPLEAIVEVMKQPVCESPTREFLRKKIRRIDVVMNMIEQTLPGSLEEFKQEAKDAHAVPPERIEHWYRLASAKWRETRGAYEPTAGTTPLC